MIPRSKSFKVVNFVANEKPVCDFLSVRPNNSNGGPAPHRLWYTTPTALRNAHDVAVSSLPASLTQCLLPNAVFWWSSVTTLVSDSFLSSSCVLQKTRWLSLTSGDTQRRMSKIAEFLHPSSWCYLTYLKTMHITLSACKTIESLSYIFVADSMSLASFDSTLLALKSPILWKMTRNCLKRSSKVIQGPRFCYQLKTHVTCTTSYLCIIFTMALSCTVLEIRRRIGRKSLNFIPRLDLTPSL